MNTKQLKSENEQLKNQVEELNNIISQQDEKIKLLVSALYAPKSEKYKAPVTENRPTLPGLETKTTFDNENKTEEIQVANHKRKKPGRKPIDENIPHVEVVHDLPQEQKVCSCGCNKKCIGQDEAKKLDVTPAKVRVIKNIRLKYACSKCEGTESDEATVQIAPLPPQMIKQGIASAGLLAYITVSKFVDALPLYRQEKQFRRYGVEISRATMATWLKQVANICEPLSEMFLKDIRSGFLVGMDETTLQVLAEPGRKNTQKSYMWLARGGPPKNPILYYKYDPSRSGKVAQEILGDFEGYLQTDGHLGYSVFKDNPKIIQVGCMAHIRRHFMDVLKATKKSKGKSKITEKIIELIKNVYKLERNAIELEYSYEQIHKMRQEKVRPILDEIKGILDENVDKIPPKATLGKAINYALNQWSRMLAYLEDGRIRPDNNLVENAIRPLTLGRKNWLFCGHPNGGKACSVLMSIIETAKANGHEPYKYLRYLFEELPKDQSRDAIRKLLPYKIEPGDVPEPSIMPRS